MKVVVTGGAGFIGSALIRYLIQETEATVVCFDALSYAGNLSSLEPISQSPRFSFVKGNVCDPTALGELLAQHRPDAVVHLAAESHVDNSIDGPLPFVETNLVGTFHALNTSLTHYRSLDSQTAERFRFLHVSTDEVYGDLSPTEPAFAENNAYRPSSPYAATKAGSDHLVRAWGRTYGLPAIITNCSNNYGPYQFPEKLIPHMILKALAKQDLPVYGDGLQIRDWLYVGDHVKALWRVLLEGELGTTYNIGGHNEVTNVAVVREICKLLNKLHDTDVDYESLITFVEDRPGHDKRYAIDATRIKLKLGWVPNEDFRSGLQKTVAWYLNNQPWWQAVLDGSYRLNRAGLG